MLLAVVEVLAQVHSGSSGARTYAVSTGPVPFLIHRELSLEGCKAQRKLDMGGPDH